MAVDVDEAAHVAGFAAVKGAAKAGLPADLVLVIDESSVLPRRRG